LVKLDGAARRFSREDAIERRLVVNAILWTAGRQIPAGGATVHMDPARLEENLEPK
jgi:hypothetical protein